MDFGKSMSRQTLDFDSIAIEFPKSKFLGIKYRTYHGLRNQLVLGFTSRKKFNLHNLFNISKLIIHSVC